MIYFVRHGQTDWNKELKIQGQQDVELNEEGMAEAKKLSEKLSGVRFDVAFSSPLKRALKTAEAVYDGKIISDERLAERGFGNLEGKSLDGDDFKRLWSLTEEYKLQGTESLENVFSRVESFVDFVRKNYPEKNVLAATHGGVMMAAKHIYGKGEKVGNLTELLPKNTEVFEVEN